MNRSKRSHAAALAGGLALVALLGCGGQETVASKSAAAFRDAQERGETFGGGGDAHGHGAAGPGGDAATHEGHAAGGPQAESAEHAHGAAAGGAGRHEGGHGDMAQRSGAAKTGGHAGHAAPPEQPVAGAGQHGGHGAAVQGTGAGGAPAGAHAGHAPGAAAPSQPATPSPVPVAAGEPARTLRPDPVDAPAATSLGEAQRSAAITGEMAGEGHGAHGGTYRQLDAGRGPAATPPPPQEHDEHEGHEPPGGGAEAGASAADERRPA